MSTGAVEGADQTTFHPAASAMRRTASDLGKPAASSEIDLSASGQLPSSLTAPEAAPLLSNKPSAKRNVENRLECVMTQKPFPRTIIEPPCAARAERWQNPLQAIRTCSPNRRSERGRSRPR